MLSSKNLELYLKTRNYIAVGEVRLKELKDKVAEIAGTRIKISGRSCKTGRRKTISIPVKDLLN